MHLDKKAILPVFLAAFTMAWFFCVDHVIAGPRALFQEYLFDAGNVKEGERISHDFIVSNQGDTPLEIFKVSPG
jgi:hypothetical protein